MKPHPFPRYRPLPSPTLAPLVWEDDGGALKLERRREGREAVEERVAASYSDGAARFGITTLEVVDRSASGLGVVTQTPIAPGMRVQVRPAGAGTAWVSGVAVRCEATDIGFRVGLKLASRRAA